MKRSKMLAASTKDRERLAIFGTLPGPDAEDLEKQDGRYLPQIWGGKSLSEPVFRRPGRDRQQDREPP